MSDEYRVNLICCTDVIRDELALGFTQKDLAVTYAMAIKSEMQGADKPDWRAINTAILTKWQMSGLERIKKRAYDILSGKVQL